MMRPNRLASALLSVLLLPLALAAGAFAGGASGKKSGGPAGKAPSQAPTAIQLKVPSVGSKAAALSLPDLRKMAEEVYLRPLDNLLDPKASTVHSAPELAAAVDKKLGKLDADIKRVQGDIETQKALAAKADPSPNLEEYGGADGYSKVRQLEQALALLFEERKKTAAFRRLLQDKPTFTQLQELARSKVWEGLGTLPEFSISPEAAAAFAFSTPRNRRAELKQAVATASQERESALATAARFDPAHPHAGIHGEAASQARLKWGRARRALYRFDIRNPDAAPVWLRPLLILRSPTARRYRELKREIASLRAKRDAFVVFRDRASLGGSSMKEATIIADNDVKALHDAITEKEEKLKNLHVPLWARLLLR